MNDQPTTADVIKLLNRGWYITLVGLFLNVVVALILFQGGSLAWMIPAGIAVFLIVSAVMNRRLVHYAEQKAVDDEKLVRTRDDIFRF